MRDSGTNLARTGICPRRPGREGARGNGGSSAGSAIQGPAAPSLGPGLCSAPSPDSRVPAGPRIARGAVPARRPSSARGRAGLPGIPGIAAASRPGTARSGRAHGPGLPAPPPTRLRCWVALVLPGAVLLLPPELHRIESWQLFSQLKHWEKTHNMFLNKYQSTVLGISHSLFKSRFFTGRYLEMSQNLVSLFELQNKLYKLMAESQTCAVGESLSSLLIGEA